MYTSEYLSHRVSVFTCEGEFVTHIVTEFSHGVMNVGFDRLVVQIPPHSECLTVPVLC